MTKKLSILLLFAFFSLCTSAQKKNNLCSETHLLISMFNKYHLTPIELNQATSEQIFNDFIKQLDPGNCIFTSPDINSIASFKTQLLDISSDEKVCSFLKSLTEIYRKRILKVDSIITDILQSPLNFNSRDSITFHPDYVASFVTNNKELEKRWIRKLKFEALDILFTSVKGNDPSSPDSQQLLQREAEIRKKLEIKEKRMLQRIMEYPSGIEAYVTEVFLNTIANRYDPHSMYFSPSEKDRFLASISKEAKAYGFSINESDNGIVQIGYLVPGGPAWKSNQLNQGDVLLQVKWPKGEILDLAYSSAEEVDNFISNSAYDNMLLTVKKANGTVITVPLVKEVLDVEENSITGYILKGDKKVGYISLPGFYTDFENPNGLGCANDVAKEILKLQKENIEGLILDLRNNGGGSLFEAIGLTGLFIDEGPLFIAKEKNQKPVLLKDMNRGRAYNGPLIVMVNGFSASASELVSAGLRDYNRALISGSTTYGKAIVQVTLPLDTNSLLGDKTSENLSDAFVNITIKKLYRLNGESHQKIGLHPDIELPDLYASLNFGEASEPYAINTDKIDKKVIYNPLPALPVAELALRSKERIEKNHAFITIKNLSDSLQNEMKKEKVLQLSISDFSEYNKTLTSFENNIEQLFSVPSLSFNVLSSSYDEAILQADNHRKEMNDRLLKNIQNDFYIEEVFLQLTDLINLTK